MARRHSMQAHAASVAGATYAQRSPATTLGEHGEDVEPIATDTAVQRVETITSNPLSGPITVPRRAAIGDTGLSAHPLALGASTFGSTSRRSGVRRARPVRRHRRIDRRHCHSFAAGRSETIIGQWMAHDALVNA